MTTSKITRNFQVTLPKEIREIEGLRVGDKVRFVVEENHRVHIVKISSEIIRKAAGLWKDMKETGPEYERRMRQEWRKRELA